MLLAHGLTKRFGGAVAVDDVSFRVGRGTVTGLIGPNGAGKTTLFHLIAGLHRPTRGTLTLGDVRIERKRPDQRVALGIGRTFQIPRPFSGMSVLDNVMVAAPDQAGERFWRAWTAGTRIARQEAELRARAFDWLAFVGLDRHSDAAAATLSGGQRKLLELARVMMQGPDLILLDEPGAGVAPPLRALIVEKIRALNEKGVTFLIIEHDMDLVMSLCRPILVMAGGKLLLEGDADVVRRDARVIEAYLGGIAG